MQKPDDLFVQLTIDNDRRRSHLNKTKKRLTDFNFKNTFLKIIIYIYIKLNNNFLKNL